MKALMNKLLAIMVCAIVLNGNQSSGLDDSSTQNDRQLPVGSYRNPVVLDPKAIKTYDGLKIEQQNYIRKHYKDHTYIGQGFTMHGERYIHTIAVVDPEERQILIYFDVTDAYKKLKARGRENREAIKKLEGQHRPKMSEAEFLEKIRKEQQQQKE